MNKFPVKLKNLKSNKGTVILIAVILVVICFSLMLNRDKAIDDGGNAPVMSVSDAAYEYEFFSDYRQKREVWRSEKEDYYNNIINDEKVAENEKLSYYDNYSAWLNQCRVEDEVAEILKGRGYADALLITNEGLSFLVVKKKKLDDTEKEELTAFVYSYADLPSGTLSVFSVS